MHLNKLAFGLLAATLSLLSFQARADELVGNYVLEASQIEVRFDREKNLIHYSLKALDGLQISSVAISYPEWLVITKQRLGLDDVVFENKDFAETREILKATKDPERRKAIIAALKPHAAKELYYAFARDTLMGNTSFTKYNSKDYEQTDRELDAAVEGLKKLESDLIEGRIDESAYSMKIKTQTKVAEARLRKSQDCFVRTNILHVLIIALSNTETDDMTMKSISLKSLSQRLDALKMK